MQINNCKTVQLSYFLSTNKFKTRWQHLLLATRWGHFTFTKPMNNAILIQPF